MVKESNLGLALAAIGVGLTGALLAVEISQSLNSGGTPIAQVRNRPVNALPEHNFSEQYRAAPAMFGGSQGYAANFGGGNFQPSPPNPRVTGPNMFGGTQGFNNASSGGETQYAGTTNPLVTGNRYGKLLGVNAGKRFVYHQPLGGTYASAEPDPVPVF
jgi:hypothetical protein